MKNIVTLLCGLLCAGSACAQPVLAGGFSGMAGINGNTYMPASVVPRNGSFVTASKDGQRFYAVATSGTPMIYFINAATFAVTDSMQPGVAIGDIAATAEADRLFAISSRALYRINTATKAVMDSILLSNVPNSFARIEERPGTKEVWVARDSMIYVVDYSGGLTKTSFTVSSAADAGMVKFSPGGSTAYVVLQGSKKLVRVNAATKALTGSISRSGSIGWPEIPADSSRIWLLDINTPRIILYDGATLAPVDSILNLQPALNTLYRHPVRNEIWGVGHFPDSATVFNATTKAVLAHIQLTSDPFFLAFGASATGIDGTVKEDFPVVLFPNPASTVLTVQLPENRACMLEIYSATGQKLLSQRSSSGWAQIPVSHLPAGTYFLRVIENGVPVRVLPWVKGL